MNATMKRTVLAVAIAALLGSSMAYAVDDEDASATIDHQHVVNDVRTHSNTVINDTANTLVDDTTTNVTNNTVNTNVDANATLDLDAAARLRLDAAATLRYDGAQTDRVSNYTSTDNRQSSNVVREDIVKTSNVTGSTNVVGETNEHGASVMLSKDLSLTSDVRIDGDITVSGDFAPDSAAVAVIDNRQSVSGNAAGNDMVTNDASIRGNVGRASSGNIQSNIAAGDNNVQDNAAALSAADASFTFGMADAEVFVSQSGTGNLTTNTGVTNNAALAGSAFRGASGNLGVNVASGNNNQQKNALSASVATAGYSTATISSNQVSSGHVVTNAGHVEEVAGEPVEMTMTGTIGGTGTYSGDTQGTLYQGNNYYPDIWGNAGGDGASVHPSDPLLSHADMDGNAEGAVLNPNHEGETTGEGAGESAIGGLSFETDAESGLASTGTLDFGELGDGSLQIQMSGMMPVNQSVNVDHTNTARLGGSALRNASGNVGINVASGTGNMQANSLALSVAQPGTGGGGGTGGDTGG